MVMSHVGHDIRTLIAQHAERHERFNSVVVPEALRILEARRRPVTQNIELIGPDLRVIREMLGHLEKMVERVEGLGTVEITFTCSDGGDKITIGFGELAEPAVLHIEPAPDPKATTSSVG